MSNERDLAAQTTATAINEVLRKLGINHIVDGVAVFLLDSGYFVDVVMRDLTTNGTWAVSFTLPHRDSEMNLVVKDESKHSVPKLPHLNTEHLPQS